MIGNSLKCVIQVQAPVILIFSCRESEPEDIPKMACVCIAALDVTVYGVDVALCNIWVFWVKRGRNQAGMYTMALTGCFSA